MQNEYLSQLSDDVRSLVEQTEQSSGIDITVVVDPSRMRGRQDQPDSLACDVSQHGARLLVPTTDHFPDGSVLHELLHIRRFLVNGVPRIVVCDDYSVWTPQLETALTQLDNSIEHLIIVPEELEHRPDREDYWKTVMTRVFNELEVNDLPDEDRERHALINSVFVRRVLDDDELVNRVAALTGSLGINDKAARLLEEVSYSLYSKERTVQLYFEHLCLPIEAGCLEYMNTHNRSSRRITLAEVDL